MDEKLELVKAELAFHGIRIMEDGTCFSFTQAQDQATTSTCKEKISSLKYEASEVRNGLRHFFFKAIDVISETPRSLVGGSPSTEKMFSASLKQLLKFCNRYRFFRVFKPIIKRALCLDVKFFSEAAMSKLIDYKICIDWLDHLFRHGNFLIQLLSFYDRNVSRQVVAQQMVPSRIFDLDSDEHDPLKERRWEWEEVAEDFEQQQHDIRHQPRYVLDNDKEWHEEGFHWREMTHDPYAYGDEDDDPYKHYYNFKSKVHRGIDK